MLQPEHQFIEKRLQHPRLRLNALAQGIFSLFRFGAPVFRVGLGSMLLAHHIGDKFEEIRTEL
jgi:hypothetical protein